MLIGIFFYCFSFMQPCNLTGVPILVEAPLSFTGRRMDPFLIPIRSGEWSIAFLWLMRFNDIKKSKPVLAVFATVCIRYTLAILCCIPGRSVFGTERLCRYPAIWDWWSLSPVIRLCWERTRRGLTGSPGTSVRGKVLC